ncbi:hypothetical protein L249_5056 [Ophiocordyceps polyrhachis-furcata BCC 54312]|uniref:Uncharacterized protein n=1 Tax=Ophiocordyceps polyrhachis-furcata BCC 54312 TaxID=1330021 RepID=A0A367L3F1_9HYPO|nr:hypothetical protein L249_5056 [Ophiocordyceps polyrhachis-furcata BCC 54312]
MAASHSACVAVVSRDPIPFNLTLLAVTLQLAPYMCPVRNPYDPITWHFLTCNRTGVSRWASPRLGTLART